MVFSVCPSVCLSVWIEKLNISALLHKQELQDTLPRCVRDQGEPTMVYKYKPTIRNKLFNYKETITNFKHDNTNEVGCSCSGSQFIDTNHRHVVTGNLLIIKNKKLRELFRKGPNYRQKQTMNWKAAISSLKEDIDGFVKKWSNKVKMPLEYFTEWKVKLLEIIHKERKVLKGKIKCRPVQKVLQDPECCRNLEELKDKYVLVPTDKAANNIGVICKKYFLQVLQEETMSPS